MKAFKDSDKPLSLCPPEKDPKWRFFWRIGEAPTVTEFPQLNASPVIPTAFPQWGSVMDSWGGKLLDAAVSVAELAAVGFGLPRDAFSSRMARGPHLLAPTASDFSRFGGEGTVLAGYHYDLNFITAHGRSRYPGLFVCTWVSFFCAGVCAIFTPLPLTTRFINPPIFQGHGKGKK